MQTFHGPRRIALAATFDAAIPPPATVERGPRATAPEQALAGFLRKHGAHAATAGAGGRALGAAQAAPAQDAAALIAAALPALLRRFAWPKSMRWGGSGSLFTWVRPLRRILCVLDGATVPFTLADGADDGHGLRSGNQTEGHRFMAPAAFPVAVGVGVAGRAAGKPGDRGRGRAPAPHRRRDRRAGGAAGLTVVDDPALLDEVAGLVEWPVPLLGRIDAAYMDLPAEVMQVSMRVNQRYFALRTATARRAPFFAFAANIEAPDGGAAIVAGNERVLRARFSDARHFWDADRRTRLADRVAALDAVTFHAKLGSQGARVHRVMQLAERIAPLVGADPAWPAVPPGWRRRTSPPAWWASSRSCRASWAATTPCTTARTRRSPTRCGTTTRPRAPATPLPTAPVAVAVALADKIDLLASFFAIGERPTGSGDPFALRRAALGIVRIIREGGLRLHLRPLIVLCAAALPAPPPARTCWPSSSTARACSCAPRAPGTTCWTRCSPPAAATTWRPCWRCPTRWAPCWARPTAPA